MSPPMLTAGICVCCECENSSESLKTFLMSYIVTHLHCMWCEGSWLVLTKQGTETRQDVFHHFRIFSCFSFVLFLVNQDPKVLTHLDWTVRKIQRHKRQFLVCNCVGYSRSTFWFPLLHTVGCAGLSAASINEFVYSLSWMWSNIRTI